MLARVVLLLALAAPAAADVYRCVSPDGSVHFTDRPASCAAHAEPVETTREAGDAPRAPEEASRSPEPADSDVPPPARLLRSAGLRALLPPAHALGGGWDAVEEAPQDPSRDPELRRAGVRAATARHYTRSRDRVASVCSVEIWAFADAASARRGRQMLDRPGWRFFLEGHLLIMLRGTTHELGGRFDKGVFPDCERIGERTRAHVVSGPGRP